MEESDAIALLERSENHRVLSRLVPRAVYKADEPGDVKLGIYLDCETTGLKSDTHEIIELGMVPFTFTSNGVLYRLLEPLNMLQEPVSGEIPEEITSLTGISMEDVRGHAIDWEQVREMIAPAALIVAHNAGFDRPFLEAGEPMFATKAWACSFKDIDWQAEGFESGKLEYLGLKNGFFYEGHRATTDCYAGLELLSRSLPKSGRSALDVMLETARVPTCRIWAENAPFDFKDLLKERGYHWNDGADGRPKAWFIDVAETDFEAERDWLRSDIYQYEDADPLVTRITSFDRYSKRV